MATIGFFNALLIFRWRVAPVADAPDEGDAIMIVPAFELIPLRTPEGLILYLKHQESPWVIRVIPVRDPDQPRLWCLRMEPCAGASLTAKTARVDPFYTSLAMTREQLTETLAAIRQSAAAWLVEQSQGDLRRWLSRITRMSIPGDFTPPDPPPRVARQAPAPSSSHAEAPSELFRKAH